jgi:hypothetical protein
MGKKLMYLMAIFSLAGTAQALEMPTVSYSADQTMESAEGTTTGMIYVTPTMERREMGMQGEQTIVITRRDKNVVWTLMPSEQMYMESKPGSSNRSDDMNNYTVDESTPVGHEVVNGISCEKTKIIMTGKDGTKMGGFWWISKEGIVIKMDMIAKDKGGKMRMKSELTNLKIGKQNPHLFEIPPGYSKMSMPGMPGMGGGGFDIKKAMDMLK